MPGGGLSFRAGSWKLTSSRPWAICATRRYTDSPCTPSPLGVGVGVVEGHDKRVNATMQDAFARMIPCVRSSKQLQPGTLHRLTMHTEPFIFQSAHNNFNQEHYTDYHAHRALHFYSATNNFNQEHCTDSPCTPSPCGGLCRRRGRPRCGRTAC
jgi:hypothetical protein